MYFGENDIIKNSFPKSKRLIYVNEVDIKRIVLSDKKWYGNKDSLLDIYTKEMLFHHYYV